MDRCASRWLLHHLVRTAQNRYRSYTSERCAKNHIVKEDTFSSASRRKVGWDVRLTVALPDTLTYLTQFLRCPILRSVGFLRQEQCKSAGNAEETQKKFSSIGAIALSARITEAGSLLAPTNVPFGDLRKHEKAHPSHSYSKIPPPPANVVTQCPRKHSLRPNASYPALREESLRDVYPNC